MHEIEGSRINVILREAIGSSSLWTLILIFCCLVFTTSISYRATQGLIEDNTWVLHTQEVIEQLLEVSANFRTAESRQRAYLFTQKLYFLENYQTSLQIADKHLILLKQSVADNPSELRQVEELTALINRRKSAMQQVLDTFNSEGAVNAKTTLLKGGGLNTMLELTTLIDKIKNTEKQLLTKRTEEATKSRTYALCGLVIGGIFSTTLVLFSYYLLMNDLRRRQQLAQELATSRKQLEIRVIERTEELQQSNRELQEFAYIASHDLQEPLRKIQVFGDRLKDKAAQQLDETSRDYLERMQNAAKRMHTLINDLLLFSRVSANSTIDDLAPVDLNQVIHDVISDLEGSIEHHGGQISVDNLPIIKANPLQMQQLLQNLLSNALKFHRTGVTPEISVYWRNRDKFVDGGHLNEKYYEISIIDNGIGIDPQFVDKIFIPFQRLHGKNDYEGTGIGLAVCRKIIERHHGYIHVSPAPSGNGTEFIIGFPET